MHALGLEYPLPCRMRIALAAHGDHDRLVCGPGFRQRAEYRFGLVLLLLVATFTFMAGGLTGAWTGVAAVLLQGATLDRGAFGRPSSSWPGSPRRGRHGRRTRHRRDSPDQRTGAQRLRGAPQCAPRRTGADRDRVVDRASAPHRRPNGARCALHLRAPRNVLGVRLRSNRRGRVGPLLRAGRESDERLLPLLRVRHPDDGRLRRPHREWKPRPRDSQSSTRSSARSTS